MTHPLRMRAWMPIAAAIVAALWLPAAAAAVDIVPGQVIVRYAPGTSTADRAEARDDAGTKAIEGLGMPRAQLLKVTDGDSVYAAIRQLEAQPGVAYAEPNQIRQPALLPDDPLFYPDQWGLYNDGQTVNGVTGIPGADISAPSAWNFTVGDLGTVVAVMDTGAGLQHPDLVDELWANPLEAGGTVGADDDGNGKVDDVNGWDFIGDSYDNNVPSSEVPDDDPTDLSGHGTHVSGIALAEGNNAIGVTGVSQHAGLMSLRICGTYDNGCPDSALIQAIHYAAAEGARVVNGSIAGPGSSQAVADALESHPNTLYVFAAGNGVPDSNGVYHGVDNDATPNYPCTADQGAGYSADNVICVAATRQDDHLATFSNYGASSVDLGAPGVNILSTSSQKQVFFDDFESGDISANWTNTGASTWAASGQAPLNGNFGITDSPSGNYAPGDVNEVTSSAVTLPSGYSSCELDYFRERLLGSGDSFKIEVLRNGLPVPGASLTRNSSSPWQEASFPLNSAFDDGGQVQVRLTLTSDNNPTTVADGVHMDDIRLFCHGTPSDNGYEFLNGTSMAAPMVSGAAALLFSDSPTATPSQIKDVLLDSVDHLADLSGTTVSGGRLNIYGALVSAGSNPAGDGGGGDSGSGSTPSTESTTGSSSKKPNTFFNRKPGQVVRTEKPRARVVFRFGSSEANSSFLCRLDSAWYKTCSKKFVRKLRLGRHVLKVRAVSRDGAEDPTAAVAKFRVKQIG
jgi:subtilisin family serine protease